MKAYQVCLYFLIFNLTLSMLNSLQPFILMNGGSEFIFWVDDNTIFEAETFSDTTIKGLTDLDFIGLMLSLGQVFLNATILLPVMLANLYVPAIVIPLIVVPAWYAYLAAIIQLATGRILPLFE